MSEDHQELPSLGRPFRLGMLYDCRSDKLIKGVTLWDDGVLVKARTEEPKHATDFEVITEDTISAKASHLTIKAPLKLSLMGGLVSVSGAAMYWEDQKSSKRVARVTLKYQSTSKFEQLGIDQLGQIQHPQAFERNVATHIVTGILYGIEAFLVFDRDIAKEEKFEDAQTKMETLIRSCANKDASLSLQGADRNEMDKIRCKFHGDFHLQQPASTFQDAIKAFQRLVGGDNSPKAVPKQVWLYPLGKLDSRGQQIVCEVSDGLVNEVQSLLDELHELETQSNDIGVPVYQHFNSLSEQCSKFRGNLYRHKANLVKHLSVLLPKIRAGVAEEAELVELLRTNDASPFSPHQLSKWLSGKQQEEKLLTTYLRKLKKACIEFFSEDDLEELQLDCDHLVCYAFQISNASDPYLEVLSNYLHTGNQPVAANLPKPWHEDRQVKQSMRVQLNAFEDFAKANKDREGVKFVVTDACLASSTGRSGPVIMLYNDGVPEEFDLPSQPGTPQVTKVSQDNISIEWSKPTQGTTNITSYNVLYKSDHGEQWMSHRTTGPQLSTTVSKLAPQASYSFKVRAECVAGLSPESGASDPVTTKFELPDQPGTPHVTMVSHDRITIEWSKPAYGSPTITSYTIFYHSATDPGDQWTTCKTAGPQLSTTVSGLAPLTTYCFKVRAECEAEFGPESKVSNPVTTKTEPPSQPGTPHSTKVSHDSITIEWSKPARGTASVTCYTVFYCHTAMNTADQWRTETTTGLLSSTTVSGLAPQTQYLFKVRAEFEAGSSPESCISDPVTTKCELPSQPGTPRVQKVSNDSATISWSKPMDSSKNITSYTVFYRSATGPGAQWNIHNTGSPQLSTTVRGLAAQTAYSFKIRSECEDGFGPESEISDPVNTELELPSQPGTPCVTKATHNNITIEWSKPVRGTTSITRYTVFYRSTTDQRDQWMPHTTIGPELSTTVRGLKPQTQYVFKVRAESEAGFSPDSGISEPSTTKFEPPSQPGSPDVTGRVSHDSVTIKWSKPAHGIDYVASYTVFYRSMNDPRDYWTTHNTASPQLSTTVSGLAPQTTYLFKVRAESEDGHGPESDPSDPITTALEPPSEPGIPHVTKVSHDSITIEWSKPVHGTTSIMCYTVFYQSTNGHGDQWMTCKTAGPQLSTTVRGLAPQTAYAFKVRAEFEGGFSPESDTSFPASTLLELPSQPGTPRVTKATHNSITIEWSKPDHGMTNVTRYTVFYRLTTDTRDSWMTHTTVSPQLSTTVRGLMPQIQYVFKVRAESEAGFSPDSGISDPVTTKFEPPSQPGTPDVAKIFHDNATIKWSRPASGAANITNYAVLYRSSTDPGDRWITHKTTDTQLSTTVSGLAPQNVYFFKVRAECEDGFSPESDLSEPVTTGLEPPSQPGTPRVTKVTQNDITIEWSMPTHGTVNITGYTVFYRSTTDHKDRWIPLTTGPQPFTTVGGLTPQTKYVFKVKAESEAGSSPESLTSDVAATEFEPPSKPGTPFAQAAKVFHDNVTIEWSKPEHGADNIMSYTVYYRSTTDTGDKWMTQKAANALTSATVTSLTPETVYCFQVRAECDSGFSPESGISGPVQTQPSPNSRVAVILKESQHCRCISTATEPHLYALLTRDVMRDKKKMIAKCRIGTPDQRAPAPERVLMVVGATGAGKSTLINGIANYILGVKWEDNFRFKLITDEGKKSQAESQTTWITAYTFHLRDISRVPFTLTVIDTPGFGDCEGLERDRQIAEQIKQFFSIGGDNGVDQLHGVGFVAQGSLPRLTPTQRYIFDSILSIYGNDIAGNIFMLVTFCDGSRPPVLDALKEAEIPHQKMFKFNNSALYAKHASGGFDKMFWELGIQSFAEFFGDFDKATAISLTLTREVLKERERLENVVQALHPQIRSGLAKMEELRQLTEIFERNKGLIEQNQDFTCEVTVPKSRRKDTDPGQYVTNCLVCNFTCHEDCAFADDEDKVHCCAMDDEGDCTACPGKCHWRKHVNQSFWYELYVDVETRTSEELKKKYDTATQGKSDVEAMIANVNKELNDVEDEVLDMVAQVRSSLKRLGEIALKPNPLTEVEYIDLLIEGEKQAAKPGWMKRVHAYEQVKERAKIMAKVKGQDFKKGRVFAYLADDNPCSPKLESSATGHSQSELEPSKARHRQPQSLTGKIKGWFSSK